MMFILTGYYKFGRILGKGSFGTVVECVRKCDERPMALKFFQYNAIHKWYAESTVSEYMDRELLSKSDFFKHQPSLSSNKCDLDADSDQESTTNEDRLLPSEVACLLRVHKIPGVVRILDYIPADEVTSGSSSSDSVSSGSESGGSSGAVGGAGDGVKNDGELFFLFLNPIMNTITSMFPYLNFILVYTGR
jgi:serine/threonine protein kinase